MATSLTSQQAAVNAIANLRPADLCRAVPSLRREQAELLLGQLADAAHTIQCVTKDERIIRFIEKQQ